MSRLQVKSYRREPTNTEISRMQDFLGLFPSEFSGVYDVDSGILRIQTRLEAINSISQEMIEDKDARINLPVLIGRQMLEEMKYKIEKMLQDYYDKFTVPETLVSHDLYSRYFDKGLK